TRNLTIIWTLSIVITLGIALLLFIPSKSDVNSSWVLVLPHLNGVLNSTTAVLLLAGFTFIRKKHINYHKTCMLIAFTLCSIFLVSYIIYHASAPSTVYGDINGDRILDA